MLTDKPAKIFGSVDLALTIVANSKKEIRAIPKTKIKNKTPPKYEASAIKGIAKTETKILVPVLFCDIIPLLFRPFLN